MSAKNLIGGLLAGAAIGVAIGMLLAPDSGEKIRANIAKQSRKFADDIRDTVGDSYDSVKNRISGTSEDIARKGREAMSMANDKVKA